MASFKLDIFKLLSNIDSSQSNIYTSLTDDEKKGFAPLVVMRWMSGTSDVRQIQMLNDFVNPYVFSFAKHPELLMQLMQVSSSKVSKRYSWLPIKSKKKNTESLKVIQSYFDISFRELSLMNPMPTKAEIMQMAEELGYQKDELKKLEKELKDS